MPVYIDPVLLAAGALLAGLAALFVAVLTWRRARRLEAHYAGLMTDADGTDLAAALDRLVSRVGHLEAGATDVRARVVDQEERLGTALRHVSVLRYKAFDAGGDQSFSVVLVDDHGDGLVLSGLHGRGGIRVYAKPLEQERSTYALTTEEESAVKRALHGADAR